MAVFTKNWSISFYHIQKLSVTKLKQKFNNIDDFLDPNNADMISTRNLVGVFKCFSSQSKNYDYYISIFDTFIEFEKTRNLAAHEIIGYDEENSKKININEAKKLMNKLIELFNYISRDIFNQIDWSFYDKLNEYLISFL
ncbi:MAG: hypothetical protein BWY97_01303 [Tenericutes bacterium ADurb.BinA124]|nr:MAG: hypothetical protein BWY97_01303 [Tenericutes bacterium ADurb.BinA124]